MAFKRCRERGNRVAASAAAFMCGLAVSLQSASAQAPSPVAQAAYDYLHENFAGEDHGISTTDGDICHLRYSYSLIIGFGKIVEKEEKWTVDFNAADIQPELVKTWSDQGYEGLSLKAAAGKQFKRAGYIRLHSEKDPSNLSGVYNEIRLIGKPDELIIRALKKVATECGAKSVPF